MAKTTSTRNTSRVARLPRNKAPTRRKLIEDYQEKAICAGVFWYKDSLRAAGVKSLFDLTDMQMLAALID